MQLDAALALTLQCQTCGATNPLFFSWTVPLWFGGCQDLFQPSENLPRMRFYGQPKPGVDDIKSGTVKKSLEEVQHFSRALGLEVNMDPDHVLSALGLRCQSFSMPK